jgi:hypothetical protein
MPKPELCLGRTDSREEEFNLLVDELDRPPQVDDESLPEASVVAVSQPGDMWRLGDHVLLCGDALDPSSYATLLSGSSAAMVFTDPPYNVGYCAPGLGVGIANDNLGQGFGVFLETACRNLLAHTEGAVYICMSSSELHTLSWDACVSASPAGIPVSGGGDYRVHDIDHSVRRRKQANSAGNPERRTNGDGTAPRLNLAAFGI